MTGLMRTRRIKGTCIAATIVGSLMLLTLAMLTGCGGGNAAPAEGRPAKPSGGGSGDAAAGDHASTGHSHVAVHGGQVQVVGDNHFELVYDGEARRFTLYVLGEDETKAAPVAEKETTLQVRDEKSGQFKRVTLAANPLEGESDGQSSRFTGISDELANLGNFDAVARVSMAGESHRVSFQFVGGKPISAGLASLGEGFACPMGCEKDKVYLQPGKCPVCQMELEEHTAGVTAHTDHSPKHGGVFFMAPDNWHHLEGTLVSERELRIYLYDNFTKPLDAAGYSGELKVQPVDDQDEKVAEPVTVPIKAVEGKPYLVALLPETIKPPYQTEARLQFPKQKEKFLFNFDFKGVQHKD